MSRLAKKPIVIPEKVKAAMADGVLTVTGPGGSVTRVLNPEVIIELTDQTLTVKPALNSLRARALVGTYASHLKNMIAGVTVGFKKELLIEGVGFKVAQAGNNLTFSLGFSHPVKMEIPATLKVTVEKNQIMVAGASKETVGQFAASLRALKKPEPYKGKGIRYADDIILRKQGKKVVTLL